MWSHWDHWHALVAVADHAGDVAGLEQALDDHPVGSPGEDAQAKLDDLDDLTARLAAAGVDPAGLLGDDELDKTVLAKARRKVVTQALSGRDLTGPMRHPPRRQLRAPRAGVHPELRPVCRRRRRRWSRPWSLAADRVACRDRPGRRASRRGAASWSGHLDREAEAPADLADEGEQLRAVERA